MKVLVDTSVWSLAFRKEGPADHSAVKKLARLLEDGEELFLAGVILQEILQAFRSEITVRQVERHLADFPLLPLERKGFVEAAALFRHCASKGISVSTIDCEIGMNAIRHDCFLLTADKDFERMAKHCDLKLL